MPKKPPKHRLSLDAKGHPVWEVETTRGVFEPVVDTAKIRALNGDALTLAETTKLRLPNFNPYQGGTVDKPSKRRNKMAYLRALSVEIKRRRTPSGS